MNKVELIKVIESIVKVEARPVKNGFQVVAIDSDGNEHIVKKGGALRTDAHFYNCRANGNGHEGISPYVQCAKKPDTTDPRFYIKSLSIEVAA